MCVTERQWPETRCDQGASGTWPWSPIGGQWEDNGPIVDNREAAGSCLARWCCLAHCVLHNRGCCPGLLEAAAQATLASLFSLILCSPDTRGSKLHSSASVLGNFTLHYTSHKRSSLFFSARYIIEILKAYYQKPLIINCNN